MATPRQSMTESLRLVQASLAQVTDVRIHLIDWIWTVPVLLTIALAASLR